MRRTMMRDLLILIAVITALLVVASHCTNGFTA